MTQTIWREGFGTTLPSKANGAAELTVPKPAAITREPRYFGAIRKCDWVSPSLTIDQAGKKGHCPSKFSPVLRLLQPCRGCYRATSLAQAPHGNWASTQRRARRVSKR